MLHKMVLALAVVAAMGGSAFANDETFSELAGLQASDVASNSMAAETLPEDALDLAGLSEKLGEGDDADAQEACYGFGHGYGYGYGYFRPVYHYHHYYTYRPVYHYHYAPVYHSFWGCY